MREQGPHETEAEEDDPELERVMREVARPEGPAAPARLVIPSTVDVPQEALDALARGRPAEPTRGDVLDGRFCIEGELGRGGMGVVYAARNLRTGGRVAIKRMALDSADRRAAGLAERFRREARAAARIRHPNVVEVYDVGGPDDAPFLVMELLEGESLRERLSRGPLSVSEALSLMDGVLRGVSAAHRANVVHRDLKPDNIFLCHAESGATERPKVLDFGVASLRAADGEPLGTLTRSGAIVGTPSYMAPEQLTGKPVDAGSDIYALGVVLYEMLTNQLPFAARSAGELAVLQATKQPRPLSTHRRDLAPSLERVLQTALARDRRDRFSDVDALRRALHEAMAAGVGAEPLARQRKRWPVIVLFIVLATAAMAWSRLRGPQPVEATSTTVPHASPASSPPARARTPASTRSAADVETSANEGAAEPRAATTESVGRGPSEAERALPSGAAPAASTAALPEPHSAAAGHERSTRARPPAQPSIRKPSTRAPRKPTALRFKDF